MIEGGEIYTRENSMCCMFRCKRADFNCTITQPGGSSLPEKLAIPLSLKYYSPRHDCVSKQEKKKYFYSHSYHLCVCVLIAVYAHWFKSYA